MILKQGDTGRDVRELQTLLNRHGAHLEVDGDFGPITRAAVRMFQREKGLAVDGLAGPLTFAKLREQYTAPTEDVSDVPRASMELGRPGLDLIKEFEGFREKAYSDPGPTGLPITIGYGTTVYPDGRQVEWGDWATKDEAEGYLRHDVEKFERIVKREIHVSLTQNQFDAMVSFAYNLGSTLGIGDRINRGEYKAAAEAMLLYNTAKGKVLPGLTRRRKAERALFLKEGG